MSKLMHTIRAGALALAAATATPMVVQAAEPAPIPAVAPAKSGYVEANGVRYYYEVRGEGPPMLLLHGGLGAGDMFAPLLPALSAKHQVITVDLQGHGRTALGERPFGLEGQGADMAAVLDHLKIRKADVVGYSMGGGVAFQFAAQHPERVNKLVLISAGYASNAFFPEMRAQQAMVSGQMAEAMKGTPMYDTYMRLAPNKADFPRLLDTVGAYMRKDYDFSAQIPQLTMPVMLVFGDADMYRPEHMVDFYKRLGGGLRDAGWQRETMSKNRLAILPGATHYDIFLAPDLTRTVLAFVEGQDRGADWTAAK